LEGAGYETMEREREKEKRRRKAQEHQIVNCGRSSLLD
jgi:hypothetical protein